MAKTFVLHDESLNTQGYWMMTAGADLSQFERNPIMLWNHNRPWRDTKDGILPIGHWENIRIDGDRILADAVFDTDEFAQTIALKVESGTLRMCSVGARPIETSEDPKYIKPGQRYKTILKWSLLEASIVDIGANNNALVALYDKDDRLIELSDNGTCPLSELELTQNKYEMNDVKKLLKLSESASEQDVIGAIESYITLKDEYDILKAKLEAIELADKEAKTQAAQDEIEAAFKDGRLNNDAEGKVKAAWLKLFDLDHEGTMLSLCSLTKHTPASEEIITNSDAPKSAWEEEQAKIKNNYYKK
ncbi:MAG: hypothetical protein LBU84_06400 [Prevotella sp.]|jgi:hypothetical protein|nr:hypothetical protein [Prevotella sp.]